MHEINAFIGDDTIVTTDVGQNQTWAMHYPDIKKPRKFLSSGTFGTVGYGLPAAIGAKTVRPDMDVMCITSDRGFQMVIQEIATSLTDDLPVTVVILNSGTLGMIKQWQKLFWSERYSATTLKCDPDFVKMAEAFSAKGIYVEKPGEIQDALMEVPGRGKACIANTPSIPTDTSSP